MPLSLALAVGAVFTVFGLIDAIRLAVVPGYEAESAAKPGFTSRRNSWSELLGSLIGSLAGVPAFVTPT